MSDQGTGGPPLDDGAVPPPMPDRRLWIAVGVLAAIVVILAAIVLLGGDDDGDDDEATTSTSVAADETTTSSTAATTTTEAEATTTTTAAPPTTTTTSGTTSVTADPEQCREAGSDPTDPESPAQAVFIAWTRGDAACAQELMTDDAFDELFSRDGADAEDVFQGCFEVTEGDPHIDCAFTYPGGSTHYRMNFSPTDGWQVFEVYQVAD